MHKSAKHIAFTIILSLFSFVVSAQSSLDAKAEKYYRSDAFSDALPLYDTLVKKYRTNSKYNHRLGVCLLETNGSLTEAEKHLKYAKSKGIRFANFYLAQVYKKQYKFDEAISTYNTYLRGIRSDNENFYFVKQEIIQCQEFNKYLQRTEYIDILSSQTVSIKDFHTHYDLSKESGKIILSNSLWETLDTNFVMYMNELEDRICYPRIIGDTLDTDLFEKNRLLDKWGVEERLSSVINSEGNELYPYILDDGLTLYFSSNGHGGLGGYDIFVTRYNPQTNKYLPPTNLGMPYNSTGDDFLYVLDEFSDKAWFASNRNNTEGEITVYSFKPNAIRKTTSLEGDELRAAARLLIKQDSLGNIDPLDSMNHANVQTAFKEEDRSIYFVVNDTLIYKSTLQFISASALNRFRVGEQNMLLLEQYKKDIALKRENFSNITSKEERDKASKEILDLENVIYEMESTLEIPFQQSRNKEMEILRNNNYALFSVEDYRLTQDDIQKIDTPAFTLTTIRNNYTIIFSEEESYQFIKTDEALNKENQAIFTLSSAQDILTDKESSTTSFWRSMRKVDTTFQYSDSLHVTEDLIALNLQEKYTSVLNHLFDKVDILEKKAQLLYLFVHGQEFKNQMQELLLKAEKGKNKSTQQLIAVGDTALSRNTFESIKTSILNCQEMYEFALVYYIEDYGGSLSLVPDSLISDTAFIDSLVKKIAGTTMNDDPTITQQPPQTNRLIYKVQLGVFSKQLSKDLLEKLPEVTIVPMEENNLKKYFTGNYPSVEEAKKDLKSFEKYGFKGAFVVPFIDGKLASWEEVETLKTSQ